MPACRAAALVGVWLGLAVGGCAGRQRSVPPLELPTGPVPVIEVKWRRQLTEPPLVEYKPQEFASAVTDGAHVFIGSKGGLFRALRPLDGQEAWKKAIPGGVSSRPLYLPDTRTVFVGGDDGVLYAFDARTGETRWSYRTHGPIGGAPVYDEGLVFFENGENRVYAIDAQSGAWRWQYERETPETFTIRGNASPLAYGGRVYAGFSDGYLAALNARTGEVIWARSLSGDSQRFMDVDATPVIAGGALYTASYSGGVYALDPASGDVKWRYEVEGATAVTVDGGRVFVAATKAGVHCLDREGRLLWRQALARQGELSPITLVQGRYMLLSASAGGTFVVDARSGALLSFFRPGHGVTAPPTSDGHSVYVLTNAGWFYSFGVRG